MTIPHVRLASMKDAQIIADFNRQMALESENFKISADKALAGVRNLMNEPSLGFYVIAGINGRAAGSLLVTREWSDWRNGIIWWIQSVYIRPGQRRKGMFRSLFEFVKHKALDEGVIGLRLYVDRDNLTALHTYERIGMRRTSYDLYEIMLSE